MATTVTRTFRRANRLISDSNPLSPTLLNPPDGYLNAQEETAGKIYRRFLGAEIAAEQ